MRISCILFGLVQMVLINYIRYIFPKSNIMSSSSESVYKPRQCAFHPKQTIFNFCKNSDCLLPLCPTCVDQHTQQHKQQKSYGKFVTIHQVINDLEYNMESGIKQLDSLKEDVKDQLVHKGIDEQALRRQIAEAKERVIGLVERFFQDFEKEANKSIAEFNVSMKETYREMETQISTVKNELNTKIDTLGGQKVLKTIIAYYAKGEEQKTVDHIDQLKGTLDQCAGKKATLVVENQSIQKMVNELSQFMYVSFENWEQDVKYVADFVKTGFTDKSNSRSVSLTQ